MKKLSQKSGQPQPSRHIAEHRSSIAHNVRYIACVTQPSLLCELERIRKGSPTGRAMEPLVCRHFQRGHCAYGKRCRYAHVVAPAPASATVDSSGHADIAAAEEAFRAAKSYANDLRRRSAPREDILAAVAELERLTMRRRELGQRRPASRYATRKRLQNHERAGVLRKVSAARF